MPLDPTMLLYTMKLECKMSWYYVNDSPNADMWRARFPRERWVMTEDGTPYDTVVTEPDSVGNHYCGNGHVVLRYDNFEWKHL